MNAIKPSIGIFALLAMLAAATSDVRAEGYIKLKDVPASLSLPSSAGSNLILTASVEGAEVESAWLATEDTSIGRVRLTRVGPADFEVNLYGNDVFELLQQGESPSEFRIVAKTNEGETLKSVPVAFVLKVPPRRLKLDGVESTFLLYQRCQATIPGSGNRLGVRAGDITHGKIALGLSGAGLQRVPTERVNLATGEHMVLPLTDGTYVIEVLKLHNYLIGDDYAELQVAPQADWHRDKIEFLLNSIAESELTFIRNGEDHTGVEAAKHFRAKMQSANQPITSVDAFIEQIASKSSSSDEPYRVRFSDGEEMDTGPWLHSLLVPQLGPRFEQAAPDNKTAPKSANAQ